MEAFFPIGILLLFAVVLSLGIYVISSILGPQRLNTLDSVKLTTYECGVKPEGNARQPFKIQFYLVAVLFLLFDVEGAFFLPWALVYRESLQLGGALLLAMAVYLALMVLGLIYVFQKDCLRLN